MCYLVSFEPRGDGAKESIYAQLRNFSAYCPITAYCWAVLTDMKATNLREYISQASPESRIFVLRSGTEAAWINIYGTKNSEWLKKNL
jgi:hypothetical protein